MADSERERRRTKEEDEQQQEEVESQQIEKQEIWSWGAGTDGQLGTGVLRDEHSPQLLSQLSLSSAGGAGAVSFLACGAAHVIAVTSCGKVLTWGRGSSGQLGHGDSNDCIHPKPVESLSSFVISHVSAGWSHSGFVSDSGCLFTCGDGSFGQLGHGDFQSYSYPTQVTFFRAKHVEQIACGLRHSLVLLKGDKVYAFGYAKRSQLGVPEYKAKSLGLPQPCFGLENAKIISICANGDHSAALSADGRLYTWGRSFGCTSDVAIPTRLPSSLCFKQAAVGWNHALLLTGEAEVFMLGRLGVRKDPKTSRARNSSGPASKEREQVPEFSKVPGLDGAKVQQIAAGSEHSALVTENGEVWTWGWGEHGQLGLGDTGDRPHPQVVAPLRHSQGGKCLSTKVFCGAGFTFCLRTLPAPSE